MFKPKQPTWSQCRTQFRQWETFQWTWIIQSGELPLKEIISELVHKIMIFCKYGEKTKPGFISEHFLKLGKGKHTHFCPVNNACEMLCKDLSLSWNFHYSTAKHLQTPPHPSVLGAVLDYVRTMTWQWVSEIFQLYDGAVWQEPYFEFWSFPKLHPM